METGKRSGLGRLRALALAGVVVLLGGCDTLGRSGVGPRPSGDDNVVAPTSELTCGRNGNSDRCKIRVSVWMENGKCQFSFAPEGLRLSRDLGKGSGSKARLTINLDDLNKEGFTFVDVSEKEPPLEFRLPGPNGKPTLRPDPSASSVFSIEKSSNGSKLDIRSTNEPGTSRTFYAYVVRVRGPNGVCVSPDPWVRPGQP